MLAEEGRWRRDSDARETLKVGYTFEAEVVRVPDEKEPEKMWWEARLNRRALDRYSNKDRAKAHVDWTIAFQIRNMHDGYIQIVARKDCWEGLHGSRPLLPYGG
jgi:hypothetical protein